MKKLIAFLLATVVCFSFAACGSRESHSDAANNNDNNSVKETVGGVEMPAETQAPATQAPATEKVIPKLDNELSGSLGNKVTFVLDTNGKLTISGEGQMGSFKYKDSKVDTPWFDVRECIQTVVIEEGVTSIAAHTFFKCVNMESIVIPSTVNEVGSVAFNQCTSLKEIVIPEGVTRLGNSTFGGCTSLTKIVLPESLTSIAQNSFSSCGITEIEIPDSVSFLGSSMFSSCTALKKVKLPASLDEVPGYCFSNCGILESVVIPDGVEEIDDKAFSDCTALKEVTVPASVTFFGKDVFKNCENVTIIGRSGSYAETYAKNNNISFKAK